MAKGRVVGSNLTPGGFLISCTKLRDSTRPNRREPHFKHATNLHPE
jgi:hypothetical protein